ncbi:uncharacterized protein LOC110445145 [Mizuhopecten yessoensis]|uniref:CABIT domain-containing protein n=1 Tax=Mizuhopecten yessoensis TaxID=6573 RepID=A0A210R051_MIZYE|nr:uncharacterized protein LOC110445145 [Mizuhopecten yessoensis]OWF54398.1 hypothetical protein KP79_PYT08614 [Mizuhopecten yessoensis]
MHTGKLKSSKYRHGNTYEVDRSISQSTLEMATATDMAGFPAPVWDSTHVSLKDVLMQCEIPMVAKITKGQFHNLGVSKIPLRKFHQDVVVHSIKTGVKVLAHSVSRFEARDGRTSKIVALDQRLSIPLSYNGWFELLSEDGRSARPIDSVYRLAREFPSKCLVRQNLKGYMSNEDGKLTFDKSKVIPAGEQLTLAGTVNGPGDRVKFLRCTDSKGVVLYLSFDQQGTFTPIANPGDVSGVFMFKDIVKVFRLPLTVKLVMGVWPKVDPSKFTGYMRLDWTYTDETAFLCPLDKHSIRITPVPTEVPLKLNPVQNMEEIKESQSFKDMMTKCNKMIANYNNTIHLIVAVPDAVKRRKSQDLANSLTKQNNTINRKNNANSLMKRSKSREELLMDEMDDLYQYIREGKSPPQQKYGYDSDEESYFEEPAYEPLDDFRARLAMLERGQPAHKNSKYYRPTSGLYVGDENSPVRSRVDQHRHSFGAVIMSSQSAGQLPSGKKDNPPPLPPRRYQRTESSPMIRIKCNQQTQDSSSGSSRGELQKIVSDPKMNRRNSRDSSGSQTKVLMDDRSTSSRTGSSGKHQSMQTFYL